MTSNIMSCTCADGLLCWAFDSRCLLSGVIFGMLPHPSILLKYFNFSHIYIQLTRSAIHLWTCTFHFAYVRAVFSWLLFLTGLTDLRQITRLALVAFCFCSLLSAAKRAGSCLYIAGIRQLFICRFPLNDESFLWNRFQNRKMEAALSHFWSAHWKCFWQLFELRREFTNKQWVPAI